ncbi:MAG TPA: adenylate/guanylate cyclase domain-containing protein, partial [archaeon]|nr:adenylate/guanylate cyclase domain-containing protein [archaeon]
IGRWPWNRDAYVPYLEKMQKAKVIAIDVSFFEKSDKDDALKKIIEKENIVLASEFSDGALLKPIFNAQHGFTNIFLDNDGVARSIITKKGDEKAFAANILEKYANKSSDEKMLINFFSAESISFSDILEKNESFFDGKIIFVGATAKDLHDELATPIGILPGVNVHASAFQTMLFGKGLAKQDMASTILIMLLVSLLVWALMHKTKMIYSAVIVVVLAILYMIIAAVLFDAGIILNVLNALAMLFLAYIANVAVFYSTEKKQKKHITNIFGKYVSKEVVDEILKMEKIELKGEKKEITILFSDIRGFTSLSEKLKPEQIVELLNTYLTAMTDIILEKKGVVDKYIGDAIMAFWGAPIEEKSHAALACEAALAMKKKLDEMKLEIKIGIGINTGEAVVGNMGSAKRINYTVIGDSVNIASRFEGLNKEYGTTIIIGEETAKQAKGFAFRELDLIKVKGKEKPVRIYELLDEKSESISHFEKGLSLYRKSKWGEAMKEFRKANDKPSVVFIERCNQLKKKPPEKWDGVYTAKTK